MKTTDKQMNISVVRFDKKRATWGVRIAVPKEQGLAFRTMLPGEFPRYWMARRVAEMLAMMYRTGAGYQVALDVSTCRRRRQPNLPWPNFAPNFTRKPVSGRDG